MVSAAEMRLRYKPEEIRVLFVGESPPRSGEFFYLANSNLFRATQEAFAVVYGPECPGGAAFLDFFQARGCYLEDLCSNPVNGLEEAQRESERESGVIELADRMTSHRPRAVATLMLAIAGHVQRAVDLANVEPECSCRFPFPRPEHRSRYVSELAAGLRKIRVRGIL